MAKIGVIVPFYDDYQYLEPMLACIASSSQEHQVIVSLCLDTVKCTPVNLAALEHARATHAELDIRVVENFKGGPCKARNDGVRSQLQDVPGIDYFFFLDADNFLGPNALDRLVHSLEMASPPAHFTYQDIIFFEAERKLIKLDVPFNHYRHLHEFFGDTGNLVRAEVFRSGDFFDESKWYPVSEDIEFYRRIGSKYNGVYCHDSEFYYRVKHVSRNQLYWENKKHFDELIEERQQGEYDRARANFLAEDFYDFVSVKNLEDSTAAYFKVPNFDVSKSTRSIFEMRRSMLVVGADQETQTSLFGSRLGSVLESQLFNTNSERSYIFRIRPDPSQSFSYTLQRTSWQKMANDEVFSLAFIPHAVLRDDAAAIADATSLGEVVAIEILWPDDLIHEWTTIHGLRLLVAALVEEEGKRLPTARERLFSGAGSSTKTDLAPLYLLNEAEIGRLDRLNMEVSPIPSNAAFDGQERRSKPDYFKAVLSRSVMCRQRSSGANRFLIVTAFLGVGGVSAGIIDFIEQLRRREPDAVIDLFISHFERTEFGVDQGTNNYKIGTVLDYIDNIIIGDLVDSNNQNQLVKNTLLAYDLVQIETSFPPYEVLKDIRNSKRPPKIVSHLYCWDYYRKTRVGFPVIVPQFSHVIDAYSSQTRLVAEYLISRDVHPSKVCHIPYSSRLSFDRGTMVGQRRARLGDQPLIYWSGRWGEQKDPELLLEVLDLVLNDPNFQGRFLIHALPEYNNDTRFYKKAAERIGVLARRSKDQLEVLWGEVDNARLSEIYAGVDVLFSTSRWEGIAFVMYEALAAGAIIVATNISANTELVEDYGERVRLSKGRTPNELAGLLRSAVDDVCAGRALAAFEATEEKRSFADRQIDLLENLLSGKLEKVAGFSGDPAVARARAFALERTELEQAYAERGLSMDAILIGLGEPADKQGLWTAPLINELKDILQRLGGLPINAMPFVNAFYAGTSAPRASGRIEGWVDEFLVWGRRRRISGWCRDTLTGAAPSHVIVLTRHRVSGPVTPFINRPDLGEAGQPLAFALEDECSPRELRDDILVLAIAADGIAEPLPLLFRVEGSLVHWMGRTYPIATSGGGYVDNLRSTPALLPERPDTTLTLAGWAYDQATNERATTIAIELENGFALLHSSVERVDLWSWLGEAARWSGFHGQVITFGTWPPRVFAIFSDSCHELQLLDAPSATAELLPLVVPATAVVTTSAAASGTPASAGPADRVDVILVVSELEPASMAVHGFDSILATAAAMTRDHSRVEVLLARDINTHERSRLSKKFARYGITFLTLADVPDFGLVIHGFRAHYRSSWRIMRWLRQRPVDAVIFQDLGATGYWTLRAKQLGLDFDGISLAVLASGGTAWRNEAGKTLGNHVVDEDDVIWAEHATMGGADLLIAPGEYMVQWLHGVLGPVLPRVYVAPTPPAVTQMKTTAPQVLATPDETHLVFIGRIQGGMRFSLLAGALHRLAAQDRPMPKRLTLLGARTDDPRAAAVFDDLTKKFPTIKIAMGGAVDSGSVIEYVRHAQGLLVVTSTAGGNDLLLQRAIVAGVPLIAIDDPITRQLCDPAVIVPGTEAALADRLAVVGQIDFAAVHHPFEAESTWDAWSSVPATLHQVPAAPYLLRERDEHMLPPISVCIPFYKHDRYVPRLVRAFLRMNLPQLQLVIVDDGTPAEERIELDRVRDRLESLGHIVHSQPNAGPGAARNKALELARHEHLLFFDSDNVPFPHMVHALWRAMVRADADSVSAPFVAVEPMTCIPSDEDALYHFHPPGVPSALSLFDNMVGDMTSLIRRSALDAVKGFHTRISEPAWEDWELFFRLSGNNFKHFVYPEPLLYYTDHPNREKTPERLYDVRTSLIAQLEDLDRANLVRIAKVLAAHSLSLRDHGVW